ncbi:MAG: PRC-barrel domain-containing protein [Planctomycetota bacterium]
MKQQRLNIVFALAVGPTLAFAGAQDVKDVRRADATGAQLTAAEGAKFASISELIGMDVWSKPDSADKNERHDLADIRDVVLDARTGRITGVILSSGGIGSFGDTLRRVEFRDMNFLHDAKGACTVWMDHSEADFGRIATLDEEALEPFHCKAIVAGVTNERARAREAGGKKAGSEEGGKKGEKSEKGEKGEKQTREAHARVTGAVMGSEFDDLELRAALGSTDEGMKPVAGQALGSIDEAWVNLSTGEVSYLTFKHGDRMLVFPLSAVAPNVDVQGDTLYFVAPATNAALAAAPALDLATGMTLGNAEFRATVDRHYPRLDAVNRPDNDGARG